MSDLYDLFAVSYKPVIYLYIDFLNKRKKFSSKNNYCILHKVQFKFISLKFIEVIYEGSFNFFNNLKIYNFTFLCFKIIIK